MNPKLIDCQLQIGKISFYNLKQAELCPSLQPPFLQKEVVNFPVPGLSKSGLSAHLSEVSEPNKQFILIKTSAKNSANKHGHWVNDYLRRTSDILTHIVFITRLFFKQGHKQYNVLQNIVSRNIITIYVQMNPLVKYSSARVNDRFFVVKFLSQFESLYTIHFQLLTIMSRNQLKMCDLGRFVLGENMECKIICRKSDFYNINC